MTASAVLGATTKRAEQVAGLARSAFHKVEGLAERLRTPLPEAKPYVRGQTRLARALVPPSLLGFVGSALVLVGASRPTSPFTLNAFNLQHSHQFVPSGMTTWYFGVGQPGSDNIFFGVLCVYAGMVLMVRAWLRLHRVTRLHPGIPVSRFVPVLCAWMAPLLVVAPLFSHDLYSYVGQGEEMTRHINPYQYGPGVLGIGGNPFASGVDSIWNNVTSPYGPVFLWLAGAVLTVVNHDYLAALVGFRFLAVVGVVLMAVFIPRLARSYGRDGAKAFVLVALNPLVLLHLVAGGHNDALMMGLLVAGLALARERHPVLGIVLCSLGALVKVPALVGVVYIGWDWLGDVPVRRRLRPVVTAGVISLAVMTAVSLTVGLGWGWLRGLTNPNTVRSWMDPATAVGLAAGKLISGVGLGDHSHLLLTIARGGALLLAAAIGVKLLLGAKGGVSSLRAIALTMLAVVLLGPVVQPWYLLWGLVLLAPIAERRLQGIVVVFSIVSSFLGLPGGRVLLHEILISNPFLIALFAAVLVGVAAVPLLPRLRRLRLEREQRVLASRT